MKGRDMMLPSNRTLKRDGKRAMGQTMRLWLSACLLFLGLQLVLTYLRGELGGMLGWYLIRLSEYPEAASGFFQLTNGFELILRMEDMGAVAALSLTYDQIARFLFINFFILLLLAPLHMGLLERFWLAFRSSATEGKSLLRWYTEPKLFYKSVMVSLILNLGCRVVAILALLPSTLLYWRLYGGSYLGASVEESMGIALLALLALGLMIVGSLASFFLYTTLYPISYCLAAQPDYSLGMVLKRGMESIRGNRFAFFQFRLSFLPWYLLSSFTYGVMELYVLPYLSFSSFQFLQAAATARAEQPPAPPMKEAE